MIDKNADQLHFEPRIREVKEVTSKGASAICVMLEAGPGNPVDRHYYTDECIEKTAASGVFEGAHAFGDHPTELEERNQPERSIYTLVGWWSDLHAEENDGKKQLIGTFNIETGNEFALNKMREAKRYKEKVSRRSRHAVRRVFDLRGRRKRAARDRRSGIQSGNPNHASR